MAIQTHSELVAAVRDWLMRDDIPVPSLITLAEAQFNRQLRLRQMVKRATTTADQPYEGLPVDCLELKRLTYRPASAGPSGGRVLQFVPAQQISARLVEYPTGDTTWYSIVGDQIQFAPAPTTGTLEIVYYARVAPLSETNTANGLLEWAPDVYLYGCLLQAAPYLRDDVRIPIWQAAYSAIVEQLNQSDDDAEYPGPMQVATEGMVY